MQQQIKAATDTVVVPAALLSWVKAISLPDAAALAALVYTVLRIAELLYGWFKRRRR